MFTVRRLSSSMPKVAIIGSGPAGFYTAHRLLKRNNEVHVDILEKLPVPFGLVRYGVAPDHSNVKNVINRFTNLAKSERYRFIGNVNVGRDVALEDVEHFYNAVVLAYGAEDDKRIGIPGEDLDGVMSGRMLFGWYNGLPGTRNVVPDFSGETVVILGHGNVAVDVARILLTPVDLLKTTDICSHALALLAESKVKRVIMAGYKGPLDVNFTIKQFREMINLPGCHTMLNPGDFDSCKPFLKDLPGPRKRLTELMMKTADEYKEPTSVEKVWEVKFFRTPVEFCSVSSNQKRVHSVILQNSSVGDCQYEDIKCSLAVRSIGLKSLCIDRKIPFDSNTSIIPNVNGRIVTNEGNIIPGLYCSGWVKKGPRGAILNTMDCAFETADKVVNDLKKGKITARYPEDFEPILRSEYGTFTVSFSDWKLIDQEEIRRGQKSRKPREKIVSIEEMIALIEKYIS